MQSKAEKIVEVYRQVSAVPSVVSGTLLPRSDTNYLVESVWKQPDLERSEHVKYKKSSLVTVDGKDIATVLTSSPQELGKELITSYSRCGKLKAVIREVNDKDQKKVQYLEIWDAFKKLINVNLKEVDKHGDVHNNSPFGSLEWSYDNAKLLYIAEKKLPKTAPYFKPEKEECQRGNEHVYRESWGEQLTEVFCPTVCVYDIQSKNVSVLSEHISSDLSVGQAIWHRDNETILFTGFVQEPFKLGLRYCPIRECMVYLLNDKQGICAMLSQRNHSVRSLRLHPTDDLVIFLENLAGGPHMRCSKLMSVKIPPISEMKSGSFEYNTIIDVVHHVKSSNDFPGLCLQALPRNCWSKDGSHIFLSSAWRSHNCALQINVKERSVKRITSEGSCIILDVKGDVILAGYSTPTTPPQIMVAKLVDNEVGEWVVIEKPCKDLTSVSWSVHSFNPELPNADFPDVECEYILYQPTEGAAELGQGSLIVNPHGGPHTNSVTVFLPSIVAMCQLGFTVVRTNYRGSIGFGQDGIDSLPGRIGTQDVSDVQQSANIVKNGNKFDRVFVTGGSHGGFITLHLIGQYPTFYSAACTRNPSTNIALKTDLADIPDWGYWETNVENFEFTTLPSVEDYEKMLKVSPMAYIKQSMAPTLLLLGELDLRVPPSQGHSWAKNYKALGKVCEVLDYKKDNHPLSSVEAESDGFVNMILWFKKHENTK